MFTYRLPNLVLYIGAAILFIFYGCDSNEPHEVENFSSLEEEINSIMEYNVDVGVIIGIIDNQQQRQIFSYGTKSLETYEAPNANTVFDIGSITKTFTGTLMAKKYLEGNFTDDIVNNYLPSDQVILPSLNGEEIRFIHLATHTSGLPRTPHADGQDYPVPSGFNSQNPYSVYTTEDVYDYLTNYCTLEFEPSTWWGYSNTGYGLLGHIVGLLDGTNYETVLIREIFDVLGMERSSLFFTEDQMTNYALGYNSSLDNVPYYTANDIFQGCGMIKSTLNDMFKYLEGQMGLTYNSLANAINLTHQPVMHQGSFGDQGIAWYILELDDGQQIIWSGGDTQGHSSYLAFNKTRSTGVIILTNCCLHGEQINMGREIRKAIIKY